MHDDADSTRRRLLQGGLALAAAGSLPRLAAGDDDARWTVIETARDSEHRQTRIDAPAKAPPETVATLVCGKETVGPALVGFGGALTESAAHVLAQLPKAKRDEVLRGYFDPVSGIGYTLARTHIGSCDFSLASWSLDDTADDRALRHFALAPMRKTQLPLIHDVQQIVGKERFRLLASPWSPPAWMKDNHSMLHGGSLREDCASAWAEHYVRFVKAMRDEEKIAVWALTVQNEPDARQPWESCLYTAHEERDFVRDHLGPAMEKAKLGDVKLFGWDHNRDGLLERAVVMLGDPACAKYLAGLALHWYQSEDYGASRQVLTRFPDKQVLFTEGCIEGGPHIGEWEPAERYARNMIGDLNNGVCGFIDWNIALDMQGGPNHVNNFCHAPVLVDTASGEVHVQPSFHYIAHFSKHIRIGAKRLQLAKKDKSLQTIAFANPDGSRVIVVCNPADEASDFTLALDDDVRACRAPGRAIQTYVIVA